MSIICAGRGHSHETVDEVRACQLGLPHDPEAAQAAGALFRPPPKPVLEVTEGIWKLGDRIIKIQIAVHGSGNLYGKELKITRIEGCGSCGCQTTEHTMLYGRPCAVCDCKGLKERYGHTWERLKGAVRILREQGGRKMTLEEAEEFGALYGFCCRCGRTLTRESSIEAGIGPICAGKFL